MSPLKHFLVKKVLHSPSSVNIITPEYRSGN
uniref:Uncharacterized protein n=1 Tax=Rhizophora mucronata TaxID=61149 RepID=A0A2P2PNB9_RHIMU